MVPLTGPNGIIRKVFAHTPTIERLLTPIGLVINWKLFTLKLYSSFLLCILKKIIFLLFSLDLQNNHLISGSYIFFYVYLFFFVSQIDFFSKYTVPHFILDLSSHTQTHAQNNFAKTIEICKIGETWNTLSKLGSDIISFVYTHFL